MKQIVILLTFLLTALVGYAQKTVTGTVKDTDGNLLSGAKVVVDGTTTETTTNNAGQFSVTVPENGKITVRHKGYVGKRTSVANKSNVIVVLRKKEGTERMPQKKSYNVVMPNSIDLQWMITHPMGYLETSDIPRSTLYSMGTTPDATGGNVWTDFEADGNEISGNLKQGIRVSGVGVPHRIDVFCWFNASGSYIKSWSYVVFFDDKSSAKKFYKFIKKQLPHLGYGKKHTTYVPDGYPDLVEYERHGSAVFVTMRM